MANEDKKTQTKRLQGMREALGYAEQKTWAEAIGITNTRWSNMETGGYPVSRDVSKKIKEKFPIFTIDYIEDGETRGLSIETLRLLGLVPSGPSSVSRD